MDVPQLLLEIDGELRAEGSPERAVQEKAYLKSRLDHYGVSVPAVRAVARGVAKRRPPLERDDLLVLVKALWAGTDVYKRQLSDGPDPPGGVDRPLDRHPGPGPRHPPPLAPDLSLIHI